MNTIRIIAAVVAYISLLAAIIAVASLTQIGFERQIGTFRSEIEAEVPATKSRS